MKKDLLRLIKKGESEKIEFKKSTSQLDKSLKSICGFLNHKGGKVYFGIDNSKIIGQEVSDQTLKSISQKIRQKMKPEISPEIKVLEIEGNEIIEVKIKEGNNKPYYLDGVPYKRVGTENPVIPPEELERIILEKRKRYWDSEICGDATLDDIDLKKIEEYIKLANETGRRKIKEKPLEVLKKLELIKNNKPTWAGILLFGKEPQRFVSQAKVHCGKFKDEITIINDELIEGTLAEQVEKVIEFIKKNLSVRFVITGKPKRQEIWEYPLDAVREAVINAICHRDYIEPSDIQIRIYDNELIVWSSGKLPLGITLEELYKPHKSVLRNKLIAQVFFDIAFIERWGSGIHRIIQSCLEQGLPEPKFEEYQGFRVIFRKDTYTEDYLKSLGLNKRQIKGIMFVKKEGKVNNKKYHELFYVSRQTASRELSDLTERGIFMQVGVTGKGTYYTLIQTPHKRLINASLKKNQKGDENE